MKKILFIVTQSEFGGAQRYVFELTSHLDPEKYEVLIATGERNGELFRKCQMSNVKCQNLKHLKRVPWPWQTILSMIEIYNLLRREKPNVLFLCSTTAGLLGSIASKFYKLLTTNYLLLTIYRIGGWAFHDPRPFWQNKLIFWAEKLTAPLKDKIIVNSEIDRQEAIKYKIVTADKIVKIYNGIDVNSLNFIPKEEAKKVLFSKVSGFKFQASSLIIGTVANFYKTKGLPYLIEAVHLLNTKYLLLNTKYLIIGDGRERKQLELLIKKYNLENQIFLLGQIPDAYKYLKAFDIFVLPSLKEGFPWIILEMMVAEIPILTTKVGAIPEIINNGREGILVEPKNSQILAEKIFWLTNHQRETEEMIIGAKENLKKFNLEKMIEETEKIIK